MSKSEFKRILKEYKYDDNEIEDLWETRPTDDINEKQLRKTAIHMKEH